VSGEPEHAAAELLAELERRIAANTQRAALLAEARDEEQPAA
jgi:hypothetical protein